MAELPDGVILRDLTEHADARGSSPKSTAVEALLIVQRIAAIRRLAGLG